MSTKIISTTILSIALAAACGRGGSPKYPLASSASAPAAQGAVDVKSEPNGNTRLAIDVRHLAPPASITAGATTYVVWVVPRGNVVTPGAVPGQATDARPINVGAIAVGNNLEGSLETTTPFQQFDVMITPEPSAVAMRPSNEPVLTATIQI